MSFVKIDGVPFKHLLTKQELSKFVIGLQLARGQVKKDTHALNEAAAGGSPTAIGEAALKLIDSKSSRVDAVIKANRALPAHKRASLETCMKIAATLDLSNPIKEPVRVWRKPKSNGGHRIIHDAGPVHRTAQQLVRRVMDTIFVPRPFQFGHLGVQRAIREVKDLVAKGYVHTAHLDIKDFYGSFKLEKLLPELPLPQGAVKHAVVGRHMELLWIQDKRKGRFGLPSSSQQMDLLYVQARSGMPQGSACSSVIGAHCVSRLKWNSTKDVALVNYVDDFLLLAKSPKGLAKAVEKLVAAIGHLPGGTFSLDLKHTAQISQGVVFLGHALQLSKGDLRVSPSIKAGECLFQECERFEKQLTKVLFYAGAKAGAVYDRPAALRLLADYDSKLRGWAAAFQECVDIEGWLSLARAKHDEWRSEIGATEAELKAYSNPYVDLAVDAYTLKS